MAKQSSLILCMFTLLFEVKVSAQDSPYYQVSGTIRNDLYQPIDYVHVVNINLNKGTITDQNGRFSIVCMKKDTLVFSSMGYKKLYMAIPDTIEDQFVFHDIYLDQDTVEIREVKIFPWKTYDEFKRAFLALDIEDKEREAAERNIALIKQQIILNTGSDPGLGYKYTMYNHNIDAMNLGIGPQNNLLNPIAWGRFIQSLKNGDFKDKNKELRKKNK